MTHLNTEDQIEQLMEQDAAKVKIAQEMYEALSCIKGTLTFWQEQLFLDRMSPDDIRHEISPIPDKLRRILEGYNCVVAERESRKM